MYAVAGGVLPALLWLWFWLREDRLHPEPRSLIVKLFLAGMLAAVLSLPLQRFAARLGLTMTLTLFLWAAIEEIVKFLLAYKVAFHRKEFDEPVDAAIYMITAALGFSALENTLFLIGTVTESGALQAINTGNLRFVGATLLHVVASGIIGLSFAFSFYKSRRVHVLAALAGIGGAVVIHSLFNLFIIRLSDARILYAFSAVWILVIGLLFAFEKIKKLHP